MGETPDRVDLIATAKDTCLNFSLGGGVWNTNGIYRKGKPVDSCKWRHGGFCSDLRETHPHVVPHSLFDYLINIIDISMNMTLSDGETISKLF